MNQLLQFKLLGEIPDRYDKGQKHKRLLWYVWTYTKFWMKSQQPNRSATQTIQMST